MTRFWQAAIAMAAVTAIGCGGGGGGGAVSIFGRVLNVQTGGPPNPAAGVQPVGGGSGVQTSLSDGSFTLSAPRGTSAILVDTNTAAGTFIFSFPPATASTDIGDVWIGPQRVTVQGTVRDATTNAPIAGAAVSFAGRSGVTNASGAFSLADVAYSDTGLATFFGIVGAARATGYFKTDFTASSAAVAGVVTVADVLMTPVSDPNPPPSPFTITGRILPSANAPGTVVTLSQAGDPVRIYNVGADGSFYFWVLPGSYTITATNGSLSGGPIDVTLSQANEIVRQDVTID